jgi:peptidoglycan hydrolase-like protein with peptidoglycan-binding domain
VPERRDRWHAEPVAAEIGGSRRRAARAASAEEPRRDGLLARLTDRILARPARAGALLVLAVTAVTIVANAVLLQSGRHPSPFFATRPAPQDAAAPAIDHDTVAAVPPVPRSRPDAVRAAVVTPAAAAATPAPRLVATVPAVDESTLLAGVQRGLADAGLYRGPIDGLFGPETREAISAFERLAGLPVTGRPTPELLDRLRETPAEAAATAGPADPRADQRLLAVQAALNEIGYGPVKVDGLSGHETADAIRRFELDNGLAVNGVADATLVERLVSIGAMDPL